MFIVAHYGEIALKGKNRHHFERQLVKNISDQFSEQYPEALEKVTQEFGRIILNVSENADIEKVKAIMKTVFGIVHFAVCKECELDEEKIKTQCLEIAKQNNFETFRISTVRSNKKFPKTSEELDREVGAYVYENLGNKNVKLKNPDLEIKVEIAEKNCFISSERVNGAGGMPVGMSGRVIVMMSGGIDSPIAAYYLLKRGAVPRYVHFHSVPYTSKQSLEKVEQLVTVLKKFKSTGKIYFVPFADVQKQIMMNAPQKLRIILYRRMMVRISEALARREKALALVSGDSLAQVASQTLENIFAVNQAATMPIFRPLIGMDKDEIMEKARQIGTFKISILPHDDCCTRLMPKNPETRADLKEILESEKVLDIPGLVKLALEKTELRIV